MSIIIHDKLPDPAKTVAWHLSSLLSEQGDRPTMLLFSGESSFEVLQHINIKKLPKHLTVSVLDERFDGHNSIFTRLSDKLFYKQARDAGVTFLDTRRQRDESLRAMGERHNKALKDWRAQYPDGYIITLQDVGHDGRIAGIVGKAMKTGEFLGVFEDQGIWAIGYHLLPKQSEVLDRMTVTLSFLRHEVDDAIFYIKPEAVEGLIEVLKGEGYLSEVPALIIRDMKKAEIFTSASL